MTPRWLKWIYNVYPPYVGAAIHVDSIAPDFSAMHVSMKLRVYNQNYVGTHFGGNLYSMVDPHFMLLLMNRLGREYVVWDQEATIRFLKPGRGTVHADFFITDEDVDRVREATRDGTPHRPSWQVEIKDAAGDVVATVRKTLYVRRKPSSDQSDTSSAMGSAMRSPERKR